jgi:hypothetical protein
MNEGEVLYTVNHTCGLVVVIVHQLYLLRGL